MSGSAQEVLGLLAEWEAADDPEPLVVATSGSTGRPKRVVLSRAAMRASADATHDRLGGPGQWLLTVPPTYVAGLQVLFRSVRAGTDPVLDGDAHAVTSMTGPRCYVSLVPTQLFRLLEKDPAPLARFDAVLVGGGPLAPAVRAEAESMGVRVVQTYGMSETCGGCVYDGVPLPGVELRIDEVGQVLVSGPMLFDGYQDDPDRTSQALRDGWLRTNDLGQLDEDGRLRILGRVDDVIISGGLKVPAHAVEQQLLADPRVREVAVVGVPDEEWGERVVAVLALRQEPDSEELQVSPREWAPKQVLLVDALPRLPNGKPDRVALRRLVSRG